MNKVTKSNFRKYFCYKLSKIRISIIFFSILNFLTTLLPAIIIYNDLKETAEFAEGEQNYFIYGTSMEFYSIFLLLSMLISIIMIIVMTVKSFRIYHKRADMDTLGCLPVSYRERFWGDFLSGLVANFVSFIPLYIVSLIISEKMKEPIDRILYSKFEIDFTFYRMSFLGFWLTALLSYLGIYAVTAFVCSCCGKKGSSVLYSFVAMAVIPGIFIVYADKLFSNTLGMDAYYEIMKNVCMLPPFGPIISIVMASYSPAEISYDIKYLMMINNPSFIVIFLLITAAFIAGAYFIGKRRRAENVGETFVFKSAYHVLTLTFLVTLIGASASAYSKLMDDSGILYVMMFSFIVYAALEISQNKGVKGFWKTAVRFAAVFGVCFAFLTLVEKTNAFGLYKTLPSEDSIKEVRISGKYFYSSGLYSNDREYIVDGSFSEVLGEHKSLINSGSLKTGDDLRIIYVMKTGLEVTRKYSVKNTEAGDVIKSFSDTVKQLPDFDFGSFGVIDEPDLGNYNAYFKTTGETEKYLRADKLEELTELLRYDLKNNYYYMNNNIKTFGRLVFITKNMERDRFNHLVYYILPNYENTIKFLNDPGNYSSEAIKNETDKYHLTYNNSNMNLRVYVSTEDTSAAAKELLSYIKPQSESNGYDNKNGVRIRSVLSGLDYTIDAADENAVLKAMLAVFREKYIQSD